MVTDKPAQTKTHMVYGQGSKGVSSTGSSNPVRTLMLEILGGQNSSYFEAGGSSNNPGNRI